MRRSGNTSRLIDRCVQEFFKNGFTFIYEGRGTDKMWAMTVEAYHRFCSRMRMEHPREVFAVVQDFFDGIHCFKIINMKIVGKKVLVEKLPAEEKVGGIFVPIKNRKENEGIVLLVGDTVTEVKPGDKVRYFKGHGDKITYEGKHCLFLSVGVNKNDIEVILE